MPVAEMQVVGQRPKSSGFVTQRGSPDGHQLIHDAHARYQQATYDGNVYIGGNPLGTPVTTQAGLSATTPVLTLFNPASSGKIGVLIRATISVNAAPAAASVVGLYANTVQGQAAPASVTIASVTNAYLGSANQPVLQCYRIATLPAAPTIAVAYMAAIDAVSNNSFIADVIEFGGDVLIGPGMMISFQSTTAVSLLTTLTWEEISI